MAPVEATGSLTSARGMAVSCIRLTLGSAVTSENAETPSQVPPCLGDGAHRIRFTLRAESSAVAEARHRLRSQLDAWRIGSSDRDVAALLASELLTNALVHTTTSEITCAVEASSSQLVIAVTDDGSSKAVPTLRMAGLGAEEGRGLLIVRSLSERWGVCRDGGGGGQVVWASCRKS
ncbi:ATP-binding protein [Streptomyces tauricus]